MVLLALAAGRSSNALAAPAEEQSADPSFFSRITIEVPIVTRHLPHAKSLEEHNWGAVVDFALNARWSLVGGEFINSYHRDTALIGARYSVWSLSASHLKADFGAVIGADLNGGYKHHSSVDPLIGALSVRVLGNGFEQDGNGWLNRSGVVFTIVPGRNTAINLALAFGL